MNSGSSLLAGALNAGKPVEEPQSYCTGDIEDHFADFDFQLTIWRRRCCHCFSLSSLAK
jgi:hypothetical protein